MTDTQKTFKEELIRFKNRLDSSELAYDDGFKLFDRASNLFLRYEQIMKSRDSWRAKAEKAEAELKELKK